MQPADLPALFQFAVAFFAVAAVSLLAVRQAAARYFAFDGPGAMSIGVSASGDDGDTGPRAAAASAPEQSEPCAACGASNVTKRCTGCKRVRYCSQDCQSKHWWVDHKSKCKQLRMSSSDDNALQADGARKRVFSGFRPIVLKSFKLPKKVLFPYDEFLKLYEWDESDFVPCGLLNGGNSCFVNVVLQCLSCTKPLVAYLLGKDHRRDCDRRQEEWCFLCEFQLHLERASQNSQPFSPSNILSRLTNIGGNLGCGRQEDAHEFMRFAIDKMQSACLDEFGGERAVDHNIQQTTLIQHIFGGYLQSQVNCTNCRMESNRYENMMDLTVEIQGDVETLEDCLVQFTAEEWLDGENKYKCDGCNNYVKAWKRLTVYHAPNILTITLKRFQSGRFGKINKRIAFPAMLDLSPFVCRSDERDMYELYAVVVHLDMLNASFFGHYICYTKDSSGQWYRVDDCKVMPVGEVEVLAQGAYMLLYARKTARLHHLTIPKDPPKKNQALLIPVASSPKANVVSVPNCLEYNEDSSSGRNFIESNETQDMDLDKPVPVQMANMSEDVLMLDADANRRAPSSSEDACGRNCNSKHHSPGGSGVCAANSDLLLESPCATVSFMNCQQPPPCSSVENCIVSSTEANSAEVDGTNRDLHYSVAKQSTVVHEHKADLTTCLVSGDESCSVSQELSRASVRLSSLSCSCNTTQELPLPGNSIPASNILSAADSGELGSVAAALCNGTKGLGPTLENNSALQRSDFHSGTFDGPTFEASLVGAGSSKINGSYDVSLSNGFGENNLTADISPGGSSCTIDTGKKEIAKHLLNGRLPDEISSVKLSPVSHEPPSIVDECLSGDKRERNRLKSPSPRDGTGGMSYLSRGFLSKSYSNSRNDDLHAPNGVNGKHPVIGNVVADRRTNYASSRPLIGTSNGEVLQHSSGTALTSDANLSLVNGWSKESSSPVVDTADFSFMQRGFLSTKRPAQRKAFTSSFSSEANTLVSSSGNTFSSVADSIVAGYANGSIMGSSRSSAGTSALHKNGTSLFSEESSSAAKEQLDTACTNGAGSYKSEEQRSP